MCKRKEIEAIQQLLPFTAKAEAGEGTQACFLQTSARDPKLKADATASKSTSSRSRIKHQLLTLKGCKVAEEKAVSGSGPTTAHPGPDASATDVKEGSERGEGRGGFMY